MKKLLFLSTLLFSMLVCVAFVSCSKDDDEKEEQTEKPDTPDTSTDAAVKAGYCPDTKHPHMINLGGGMFWACCNVGAKNPYDFGGFYAWGELEEKKTYNITTYEYSDKKNDDSCWELDKMFKYRSYSMPDHYSISSTQFDVAFVKWGKQWMMPNDTDAEKLIKNCKFEMTKLNGVDGCKLTGPSKKYIFLPAGGFKFDNQHQATFTLGTGFGQEYPCGLFWVGTRYPGDFATEPWDGEGFYFCTLEISDYPSYRPWGQMVRPIKNSFY